ncbi:hypothetical protein PAMP_008733 [Pampus punctatissimus]
MVDNIIISCGCRGNNQCLCQNLQLTSETITCRSLLNFTNTETKQKVKNPVGLLSEGEKGFIGGQMDPHQRADTVEKTHLCDLCQKSFGSSTCEQCGRSFSQSGYLKRHQHIHTGEKPYKCEQSGRRFPRSEYLKTHQCIHTGDKPHTCEQCRRSFTR